MDKEKELHVLLVDDDEDEYVLLKELARKFSFKPGQSKILIEWMPDYDTAFHALKNTAYDAALVDYRLGERSGLDLLQEIQAEDIKTPVILLTGQGSYDVDIAAMEGGAADYLIKDQVDAPLLERSIRYAIEQKKIQEQLEVRVRERTAELEEANRELKGEIARRERVERELRTIQAELEDRVAERTTALVQTNRKLDAIFNHLAEAVTVYDPDGFLLKVNQAAVEFLGADLVGMQRGDLDGLFSFRQIDDSPINGDALPILRAMQGEIVRQEPYLFTNAAGRTMQILFSATPMYGDEGEFLGVVTISRDVTEREHLMEQLAVEQARLQAVIENAASGIVVADEEGRVVLWNPVADHILGGSISVGQALAELTWLGICCTGNDGNHDENDLILLRAALHGEAFTNVEMLVQPPGKESLYLLANVTPIYDSHGKRNGAVGVFQDITARKQMEENLHRRATRGQLLATLSGYLAEAGLNDRVVLDTVTRQIAERVGDACIIRLLSEDGQRLEPVSFYVNHPEAYDHMQRVFESFQQGIEEGPSGYVMRSGRALLISEITPEEMRLATPREYWDWLEQYPVCSLLIVPLRIKDHLIGVLMLMRLKFTMIERSCLAYTEEDLTFFEDLAGRTALAIENARLYEEVQRLSVTDPLTGLYNRRGLVALSENELRRSHRMKLPMSLMMLDIDLFKRVNDRYGHPVGDEVLAEVARRLRGSLRNQDILARYGGEEFAILLPDCSRTMGLSIASRLRRLFESTPIETEAGPIAVTVSIGMMIDELAAQNLESMVERADMALYRAKQNGRNRVELDGSV